jgi:hypothetical protein
VPVLFRLEKGSSPAETGFLRHRYVYGMLM